MENNKEILNKLIEDYYNINKKLSYSIRISNKKSLINASKVIYEAIKILSQEVKEITNPIKLTLINEYENSPNVIYIKNDKGIYRTYNKINYYMRNIIYASYGYGIDLKHFIYKELQDKIKTKEVELR